MSRIGNFPIEVPTGVEVQFSPSEISVKGPLGTLKQPLSEQVTLEKIENRLQFKVANESHAANALSGTMRALVANMVQGGKTPYLPPQRLKELEAISEIAGKIDRITLVGNGDMVRSVLLSELKEHQ